MQALSLTLTSMAISTVIAIPIGISAARCNTMDTLLRPILDGMQTMPSFVYAVPPAIRLTN